MMKSLILLLALEFGVSYISLTCAAPVGISGVFYHINTILVVPRGLDMKGDEGKLRDRGHRPFFAPFVHYQADDFKRMTTLELETLKNLECPPMLLPKNRQPLFGTLVTCLNIPLTALTQRELGF
ncbi:hypothetical protein C8J57DRAFT_1636593 [Mycena rebaudengoi]|nr:hypothetical protein C8J57DRAFT_1636593 [Mycena rebaudengoi]